MIKSLSIILITFLFSGLSSAQQFNWFPADLNVQPFTANLSEPRGGFLFALDENKIRLDVGTSRDVLHIYLNESTLSFGADLFTYTRLRSENEFHFPVETIDYLFGINSAYKVDDGKKEIGIRFRFSHISAHLADGQYDKNSASWKDGNLPDVYSREFAELFPFFRVKNIRMYLGFTYLIHTSPDNVKKTVFQLGGDYFLVGLISDQFTPFAAYDFKLNGINNYIGNNSFSAGIKFGRWNGRGFSVYFAFLSGLSIHGEYFDLRENYSNLGFNLDL